LSINRLILALYYLKFIENILKKVDFLCKKVDFFLTKIDIFSA